MLITLPSGLVAEARSLKVGDLTRLADQSLAKGLRNIDLMLGALTRAQERGPYPVGKDGGATAVPAPNDLLTGDRMAALIDVRAATWGALYDFTVRCEECGEPFEWELDLRDLPRRPYPKETIAKLAEGHNHFTTHGPGGEEIAFKLLKGADEKAIDKFRRDHGGAWGIGDSLRQKIKAVEGVDASELSEWIDDLDGLPARELAERMDLVDGGVDTTIGVVCTKCQWEHEITLPFGKRFFAPGKRRTPKTTGTTTDPTTPTTTTPAAAGTPPKLSERSSTVMMATGTTGTP